MKKILLHSFFWTSLFWQGASLAFSSSSIDEKLKLADEIRSSNPQQFLQVLKELQLEKSALNQNQTQFLKYLEAYRMSLGGKFAEALIIYDELYKNAEDNELKFRALSSIINTHAITRDYYSGSKAVEQLLNLRKTINNQELVKNSYITSGIFYGQTEQHILAIESAKNLLGLSPNSRNECYARYLLIESSIKIDAEFDNFTDYVDQSIAFCEALSEKVISSAIIINKAKHLLKEKKFTEASNLLNSKSEFIETSNYGPILVGYNSTQAQIQLELNNLEASRIFAQLAVEKSSNFGYLSERVDAFFTLYQVAEQENLLNESLNQFKNYHYAQKAYLDEVKTKQIAVQQVKNEALEKENQIVILDKENALLKTQAALSSKEAQNNQLLLALACSLLILLFMWMYRSRRIQLRLKRLAETDALTGINNRNHFTITAEHMLRQSSRAGLPVSFVLFDLDHFKKINDNYGHQTGDWALKNAVEAAKTVCRSNDIIGRMGGEEFALILPNCNADKASKLAEMCRKAIENIQTQESGHDFAITASFGVSDSALCEYDFDQLYGCADTAMYKSKSHGRNQVYKFTNNESAVFG